MKFYEILCRIFAFSLFHNFVFLTEKLCENQWEEKWNFIHCDSFIHIISACVCMSTSLLPLLGIKFWTVLQTPYSKHWKNFSVTFK